jgi:hypothetical protein
MTRARFTKELRRFLMGAAVLLLAALAWQRAFGQQEKHAAASFKIGPWKCVEVGDGTHIGDSVTCHATDASASPPWMMLSTLARLGVDCTGKSSVRADGLVVKRASDGGIVNIDACAVAEEDGPFIIAHVQ